jgi:hypothetical protein
MKAKISFRKQNAHMKWAFATSLIGLGIGCAGKI